MTASGLLAVLGAALAGCSSSSPARSSTGTDLITPGQALTIVQQTDAKAVQANGALNTSLQDTFETGPAALADDAGYIAYRVNNVKGLPPFTTADTRVYVPHQRSYPLQFLSSEVATGKTSDNQPFKSTSISLFVKPSANDVWKIYYEAYSNTASDILKVVAPPTFALDAQGFARTIPSNQGGTAAAPSSVATTVAGYINSGSGPIEPGDFTSVYRTSLMASQARQAQACSCHVTSHMSAAGYPAYAYQLQDGSALVLYATELSTDLTGGQFHSDGSGMGVLGPPMSGDFNSLTVTMLEQQVAAVPAQGNISVMYSYEQQTMVSGGGAIV